MEELAQEWNTDPDTIHQYIDNKSLRVAAKESAFNPFKCFRITEDERAEIIERRLTHLRDRYSQGRKVFSNDVVIKYCKELLRSKNINLSTLESPPPYLYSLTYIDEIKNIASAYPHKTPIIFENFNGDLFFMLHVDPNQASDHTLYPAINSADPYDTVQDPTGYTETVIPKEEKERFERKYFPANKGENNKSKNYYCRTIYTLAAALCDGLQGKHYSDADLVITALDTKLTELKSKQETQKSKEIAQLINILEENKLKRDKLSECIKEGASLIK